jgi:hypothetical protein
VRCTPASHYNPEFIHQSYTPLHAHSMHKLEILAFRKSLWEKVASRSHNPIKIFPFGAYADEVMLYGTVKYGMKAGGENEVDWAARAKLVKEDGKVKMAFYQVYLVSWLMMEKGGCKWEVWANG